MFAYVNIADQVIIDYITQQNDTQSKIYLYGFDSQVEQLEFSKDAKYILCATKTQLYIYIIQTQQLLFQIQLQDVDLEYTKDYFISQIKFINQDQILVGTTNGYIFLFNLQEQKQQDVKEQQLIAKSHEFQKSNCNLTISLIEFIQVTKSNITGIVDYQNFDKTIIYDEDGQITIINSSNLKQNKKGIIKLFQSQLTRSAILSHYLCQNDIIVFGSLDNKIVIFDLQKLQIIEAFTASRGDILDVQIYQNKLMIISSTGELNIFDFNYQVQNQQQETQAGNSQSENQYLHLLYVPDINQLIQTQQSNTQMRQSKLQIKLSLQTILIGKFINSSQKILCKTKSNITILNISNLQQIQIEKYVISHHNKVTQLQQNSQNQDQLISSGKDGKLYITNIFTGQPESIYSTNTEIISIQQYQETIIIATHSEVKQLFKQQNQFQVCAEYICKYKQIVKCLLVNDLLIVATLQGELLVFNLKTNNYQIDELFNPTQIINVHMGSIIDIDWYNDYVITIGVDLNIGILKISNKQLSIKKYINNYGTNVASCLSVNDSGIIAICCYDHTVKTFSLQDLKLKKNIVIQSKLIEDLWNDCKKQCTNLTVIDQQFGLPLAINNTKDFIFVGTTNGQILQFNNQLAIQKIMDQEGKFISDSISQLCLLQNKYLASGLENGSIEIWDIQQQGQNMIQIKKFQTL